MLRLLLGLLEELKSDLQDRKKSVEDEESRQIGHVRLGDHSIGIQLVYNFGGIVFHGKGSRLANTAAVGQYYLRFRVEVRTRLCLGDIVGAVTFCW